MSESQHVNCHECDKQFRTGFFSHSDDYPVSIGARAICRGCYGKLLGEGKLDTFRAEQDKASEALRAEAGAMPLTTAFTTSAGPVIEEIDVITSECVYGINLFKDMFGAVRDVVGGRAGAHQKVLKDLRQTCLDELRMNAVEVGADAVIGIDLDYSEISGRNGGLLMLVASGTAVKLGPKEVS